VTDEILGIRPVERTYRLDDLTVRQDGTGRVVEAYAAVFSKRSEIRDSDGHYHEENSPTSFTKTIKDKGPGGFQVLFNHARTIDGAPNAAATLPIGVPLEVRSDSVGVFTATEYLENPLADWVLNAIKRGALKSQSYSGRFIRSVRSRPAGGQLPVIVRQEVDMREYGPAVFAAFTDASILGTRAQSALEPSVPLTLFLRALATPDTDARLALLGQYQGFATLIGEPENQDSTSSEAAGEDQESREAHSRSTGTALADRIKSERIKRGIS
jgi:HK97 family phage prohead protease